MPTPTQAKAQGKAVAAPNLGNWQDDDILEYLKETIAGTYKKDGYELPSIHGVAFLAKPTEEKFLRSLSSRNNGNFVRISAPSWSHHRLHIYSFSGTHRSFNPWRTPRT